MVDLARMESKAAQDPRRETSHTAKTYNVTREGLAEILTAQRAPQANGDGGNSAGNKNESSHQNVFYNPIQQYNRDLSVLAIRAFSEDLVAFRLARQEQQGQKADAQRRGKKRKREQQHERAKRKRTPEEEGCILASGPTTIEPPEARETSIKEPRLGNGHLPIGNSEEENATKRAGLETEKKNRVGQVDGMKSAEANLENPHENSSGNKTPLDVEGDAFDKPKGPTSDKVSSFTQPFRILDALSATGLRALRYAKEIPLATSLVANDLSPSATISIKANIAHNDLTSKISTITSDATDHMYSTMSKAHGRMPHPYHVIDLDPYGTAAPFLDAAVQAVVDGGLLCVTCTDAGVFASVGYLEKTFSQYGGLPLKGSHAHEAGLRLILHAIATSAARYGIAIEPLLSLSIDYYARVFVRVHRSPAEVKFLASRTMMVYQCDSGCGSWSTHFLAQAKRREARNGEAVYKFTSALGPSAGTKCEHCGFKTHLAGPMWGGALHNPFFVQRILDMLPGLDKEVYQTLPRMEGMLTMALEEDLDDPWASEGNSKGTIPASSTAANQDPPSSTSNPPSNPNANPNPTAPSSPTRPIPPLPPPYRAPNPFFIHPPTLARTLNTLTPSDSILRSALHNLGYATSRSHTKPGSIITNAPFTVVWEIMREWAVRCQREGSSIKSGQEAGDGDLEFAPNTAGAGIMRNARSKQHVLAAKRDVETRIASASVESVEDLKKELEAALYRLDNRSQTTAPTTEVGKEAGGGAKPLHELEIRFDTNLGKETGQKERKGRRMVRYQMNPKDWGPRGRAKG